MFHLIHGYNIHNTCQHIYMHLKQQNSDLAFEKKHTKAQRDGVT